MNVNFLGAFLREFALALSPMVDIVTLDSQRRAFLAALGIEQALAEQEINELDKLINIFDSFADDTLDLLSEIDNDSPDPQRMFDATSKVASNIRKTIQAIKALKDGANLPTLNSIAEDILDYLLFNYLAKQNRRLLATLTLLGVVKSEWQAANDFRKSYIKHNFDWSWVPILVTNPSELLGKKFGFAKDGSFNSTWLLAVLSDFLNSLNISNTLYPLDTNPRLLRLVIPLYWEVANVQLPDNQFAIQSLNLQMAIEPIPKSDSNLELEVKGLMIKPVIDGNAESEFELDENSLIQLKGSFQSTPPQLEIFPEHISIPIPDNLANTDIAGEGIYTLTATPDDPWILFGSRKSSRLELHKFHILLRANGTVDGDEVKNADYLIALAADDLRLVIEMGDADGFLQKYLGDGERSFTFACGLQWSSRTGFGLSFGGATKLEAILPIRQTIANIVDIERIHLGLSKIADQDAIRLVAAFSGGLRLGPVQLVIDQVGMQADLIVHQDKFAGLFGALDFDFGFKPPTSVGVTIDADIIRGGGFLSFDRENEQYAGVVQLEIEGLLSLKGIGLITTRMPDGSKGFSLLIIITAEFSPIQLGYGFTLNGVGGLLGLNRTMQIDALRNTLYAGGIDSLLFPQDPVANALRIVGDIQKFFPPAEGRFLVALMARIGWGSPESILTIDLGIIFEFPEPIRVALIGRLRIGLPTLSEAKPLILLQVDFLGVLDLAEQEVAIDATLHHSYITSFPISGDMALRLRWGKQASFALSVGGFHPRFVPPSGFPALRRMTMSLASGNPRITVEGYLAVTTNTVQIGGAISLYYKKKFDLGFTDTKVRVSAGLYFDALIQFDPFHFEVEIGGYAEIETDFGDMSVSVTLSVSGPQPWHVSGKAKIKVCGHKLKVRFSHTLGDETNTAARLPVDPQTLTNLLLAELGKVKNWRSELPSNERPLLLFAKPTTPAQTDTIYIHPFADLIFQQRVVPFETELSQFGNQPLSRKTTYQPTFSLPDGQDRLETKQVDELFATAQFKQMNDEQKLTSPAFTTMTGGYELGASEFDFDNEGFVTDSVTFETIVVGGEQNCPAPEPPHAELIKQIFANSAVGQLSRKFGATGRKDVTWTPQIKVKLP